MVKIPTIFIPALLVGEFALAGHPPVLAKPPYPSAASPSSDAGHVLGGGFWCEIENCVSRPGDYAPVYENSFADLEAVKPRPPLLMRKFPQEKMPVVNLGSEKNPSEQKSIFEQISEKIERMSSESLEAMKEGFEKTPFRIGLYTEKIFLEAWHQRKHELSREIVRRLPERYHATEGVYTKPLPASYTYQIVTNGPVSEVLVGTLCEEIEAAGIRQVDLVNQCASIVFDKAPFRF